MGDHGNLPQAGVWSKNGLHRPELVLEGDQPQRGATGQLGRQCGNREKPHTPARVRVWQGERAAQQRGIPGRLDSYRHKVLLPNSIPKKFKTKV